MAWHSGKPADTDFLSASVQHIRENFAELEPLQPHVAELVDLTVLHPRVAELVDLTTLHPHIAALLDSRIVEMGSNANGYYARWENGLQVCWRRFEQVAVDTDITWNFPAEFVAAFPFGIASRGGGWVYFYLVGRTGTSLASAWVFRVVQDRGSTEQWPPSPPPDAYVFAIGRWK